MEGDGEQQSVIVEDQSVHSEEIRKVDYVGSVTLYDLVQFDRLLKDKDPEKLKEAYEAYREQKKSELDRIREAAAESQGKIKGLNAWEEQVCTRQIDGLGYVLGVKKDFPSDHNPLVDVITLIAGHAKEKIDYLKEDNYSLYYFDTQNDDPQLLTRLKTTDTARNSFTQHGNYSALFMEAMNLLGTSWDADRVRMEQTLVEYRNTVVPKTGTVTGIALGLAEMVYNTDTKLESVDSSLIQQLVDISIIYHDSESPRLSDRIPQKMAGIYRQSYDRKINREFHSPRICDSQKYWEGPVQPLPPQFIADKHVAQWSHKLQFIRNQGRLLDVVPIGQRALEQVMNDGDRLGWSADQMNEHVRAFETRRFLLEHSIETAQQQMVGEREGLRKWAKDLKSNYSINLNEEKGYLASADFGSDIIAILQAGLSDPKMPDKMKIKLHQLVKSDRIARFAKTFKDDPLVNWVSLFKLNSEFTYAANQKALGGEVSDFQLLYKGLISTVLSKLGEVDTSEYLYSYHTNDGELTPNTIPDRAIEKSIEEIVKFKRMTVPRAVPLKNLRMGMSFQRNISAALDRQENHPMLEYMGDMQEISRKNRLFRDPNTQDTITPEIKLPTLIEDLSAGAALIKNDIRDLLSEAKGSLVERVKPKARPQPSEKKSPVPLSSASLSRPSSRESSSGLPANDVGNERKPKSNSKKMLVRATTLVALGAALTLSYRYVEENRNDKSAVRDTVSRAREALDSMFHGRGQNSNSESPVAGSEQQSASEAKLDERDVTGKVSHDRGTGGETQPGSGVLVPQFGETTFSRTPDRPQALDSKSSVEAPIVVLGDVLHIPESQKGSFEAFIPEKMTLFDPNNNLQTALLDRYEFTGAVISDSIDRSTITYDSEDFVYTVPPGKEIPSFDGYRIKKVYQAGGELPEQNVFGSLVYDGKLPTEIVIVAEKQPLERVPGSSLYVLGRNGRLGYHPWLNYDYPDVVARNLANEPQLADAVHNYSESLRAELLAEENAVQQSEVVLENNIRFQDYMLSRSYSLDFSVPQGHTSFPTLEALANSQAGFYCQTAESATTEFNNLMGIAVVQREGGYYSAQNGKLVNKLGHALPAIILPDGRMVQADMTPPDRGDNPSDSALLSDMRERELPQPEKVPQTTPEKNIETPQPDIPNQLQENKEKTTNQLRILEDLAKHSAIPLGVLVLGYLAARRLHPQKSEEEVREQVVKAFEPEKKLPSTPTRPTYTPIERNRVEERSAKAEVEKPEQVDFSGEQIPETVAHLIGGISLDIATNPDYKNIFLCEDKLTEYIQFLSEVTPEHERVVEWLLQPQNEQLIRSPDYDRTYKEYIAEMEDEQHERIEPLSFRRLRNAAELLDLSRQIQALGGSLAVLSSANNLPTDEEGNRFKINRLHRHLSMIDREKVGSKNLAYLNALSRELLGEDLPTE